MAQVRGCMDIGLVWRGYAETTPRVRSRKTVGGSPLWRLNAREKYSAGGTTGTGGTTTGCGRSAGDWWRHRHRRRRDRRGRRHGDRRQRHGDGRHRHHRDRRHDGRGRGERERGRDGDRHGRQGTAAAAPPRPEPEGTRQARPGRVAPARPDRAAAPAPPRPMPRAGRGRRCSASRWASPRCGLEAAAERSAASAAQPARLPPRLEPYSRGHRARSLTGLRPGSDVR